MPTGYTSDIYDGKKVQFQDFVMNCARNFGALAELRDDHKAKIPDKFEPSDYYINQEKEARQRLRQYLKMSDKDWEILAEKNYN